MRYLEGGRCRDAAVGKRVCVVGLDYDRREGTFKAESVYCFVLTEEEQVEWRGGGECTHNYACHSRI